MRSPLLTCCMVVVYLVSLVGCAKQPDLPETIVNAATKEDFARFRAELGARFAAERLKEFDTATQELQLDAMNRDMATAEARELDMLGVANGKPVQAVVLLGWQARKARFLREIAELDRMLQHDLELQARTAATGTPPAVTQRIGSEREVLAQLHRKLAETEIRLAELARPGP
ncbi:MAG: hypothetical protein PSV13_09685 [Lacunisphaera sp.]|nr:hypothetical protein [Lacunisphaera sp.]